MPTLDARRIRLKAIQGKDTNYKMQDQLHSATPSLWKGNDVQFEIGIYIDETTILSDVSNLNSMTLRVRKDGVGGDSLAEKTISSFSNCTEANWTTNKTGYHGLITFTGTEMNIATGTHWLVIEVVTNTGKEFTLGATTFVIAEDGVGSEGTPQVTDGLAYTKDQADARYLQKTPDQSWVRWYDPGTGGRFYHYVQSTDLWYPEIVQIVDGQIVKTMSQEGITL